MFAEAVRGVIGSLLATSVLVMLIDILDLKQLEAAMQSSGAPGALGVGCAVAFIGATAFDWLQARLRALFGIDQKVPTGGTSLGVLDDIGVIEIDRLAEEGIRSVEALVATSVPRLFFGTRFSLHRILGWHDLGLLVVRVGADAATELRGRWGLRGSLEVRRAYNKGKDPDTLTPLKELFKKTLRVDNEHEAEFVIWQIAEDDRVKLTQLMHHTGVVPERH